MCCLSKQIQITMKHKFVQAHLKVAEIYAQLSYAKRRKVGCVVVKDDTIIAIGYNGTPSGYSNECEDENGNTHPEVIHAEQNALDKIIRSSLSSVDADLFVTCSPCLECAKRIHGARIRKVFYRDKYSSDIGINYLANVGVICEMVKDNAISN
jgi:dCMP deaminase